MNILISIQSLLLKGIRFVSKCKILLLANSSRSHNIKLTFCRSVSMSYNCKLYSIYYPKANIKKEETKTTNSIHCFPASRRFKA